MIFWTEWDEGSARWGFVPNEQIDQILAYAESVIGRPPDTLA